jgi:hypothetical protein
MQISYYMKDEWLLISWVDILLGERKFFQGNAEKPARSRALRSPRRRDRRGPGGWHRLGFFVALHRDISRR